MAYGAGLRTEEVVALKVGDIDNTPMTLRIEQGKGRKDRSAMLWPVLLGLRPTPKLVVADLDTRYIGPSQRVITLRCRQRLAVACP